MKDSLISVDDLPTPLARALHHHRHAEEGSLVKIWSAVDTVEIVLRILAVMGLAHVRTTESELPQSLHETLRSKMSHPSLAQWRTLVQHLSQHFTNTENPPVVLPDYVCVYDQISTHLFPHNSRYNDERASMQALRNHIAHINANSRHQIASLWDGWQAPISAALESLQAFTQLSAVGLSEDRTPVLLRGLQPGIVKPADLPQALRKDDHADTVYAMSAAGILSLWPFVGFGAIEPDSSATASLVYFRRSKRHLYYSVYGDTPVSITERGDSAIQAMITFLEVVPPAAHDFSIEDFEDDRRELLVDFYGHQSFLDSLETLLLTSDRPVWLTGDMGIGKSACAAQIYWRLIHSERAMCVLHFRFNAGDLRCSRGCFLEFAQERLAAEAKMKRRPMVDANFLSSIRGAIATIRNANKEVVIIADGVDEIERGHPEFVDATLFADLFQQARLLIIGRDQGAMLEKKRKGAVESLSVPGLDEAAVRSFFMDKTDRRKYDFIQRESEVSNLCQAILEYAEGLPLYIRFVIDAFISGNLVVADIPHKLPKGLTAFYHDFFRDLGLGTIAVFATRIAALLAVAREPLTRKMVDSLVAIDRLIPPSEREINGAIDRLEPLLAGTPSLDSESLFQLTHHSAREYIMGNSAPLGSELPQAHASIIQALERKEALHDSALERYVLRFGIHHLIELQIAVATGEGHSSPYLDKALSMLCSPSFREQRRHLIDPVSLFDDIRALDQAVTAVQRVQLVSILLALIADETKCGQGYDLEWLHGELVYRDPNGLYDAFLRQASEPSPWHAQGLTGSAVAQLHHCFLARQANVLRRGGDLNEAQQLLQRCITYHENSPVRDHREAARVEYDLGYIELLRGNALAASNWFHRSAATAAEGGDPVGEQIGLTVAAGSNWLHGRISGQQCIATCECALAVFSRFADTHPSAARWITNAISHQLKVAAYEGLSANADALVAALHDDAWSRRFGRDAIIKRATRWQQMAHERFNALYQDIQLPDWSIAERAGCRSEGASRDYYEKSLAAQRCGMNEAAIECALAGLVFPEAAGNRPYQERMRQILAAL